MVGKYLKSHMSLIFLVALLALWVLLALVRLLNEITILTGILVIITAWYAYSTSKSTELMAKQTEHMLKERERHLLIRTIERHTDDLRKLTKRWLDEIPGIDDPSKMILLEPTFPAVEAEKEYLFLDIKEHVPSELDNLFPMWESFKNKLHEYNKKRFSFSKKIQEDITTKTGLPYDPSFNLHSICGHFMEVVYEDAFRLVKNEKQRWLYERHKVEGSDEDSLLTAVAYGLAHGTRSECEKADKVLGDLLSGLKESEYLVLANALLEDKKKLDDFRIGFIRKVNDFFSIPILPKECKYIKLSIGP